MQAYARAEFPPLDAQSHHPANMAVLHTAPITVDDEMGTRTDGTAASSSLLASLILDGLDARGLAVLARRLLPFLERAGQSDPAPVPVAYTVATLAAELDVSQKAIRCAIARRELEAVKRGSRWIISSDAVRSWATQSERRRTTRQPCGAAPKSAGPSLRAVLCGGTSRGSAR